MIVQMKKVSLVVLNKERKEALKQLKKVGVVHLEHIEGKGEQLAAFKEASNNAVNAASILAEIKLPKKVQKAEKLNFRRKFRLILRNWNVLLLGAVLHQQILLI